MIDIKPIMFSDCTSIYGAARSYSEAFGIPMRLATKVAHYARRNRYPMLDATMLVQYTEWYDAHQKMEQLEREQECPLEAEAAMLENEAYEYECGIGPAWDQNKQPVLTKWREIND